MSLAIVIPHSSDIRITSDKQLQQEEEADLGGLQRVREALQAALSFLHIPCFVVSSLKDKLDLLLLLINHFRTPLANPLEENGIGHV